MTYKHDWPAFQAALARAELLMLDFDGPICSVFSGFPASEVAALLRDDLRAIHRGPLREIESTGNDPFNVLGYAASFVPEAVAAIDAKFSAYECEAVRTAAPTPGAHDLIDAWLRTGRPLAIVSNNSTAAVGKYLGLHDLDGAVDLISARTTAVINRMKPSPHLLRAALDVLEVAPVDAAFVGDSASDMHAGAAASVVRLAFANRPGKCEVLGPISDVLIEHFEY